MRKIFIFLIIFSLTKAVNGQVILITVKNERLEIAKAIKFLDSNKPRMIGVNIDLECFEGKADEILASNLVHTNSLLMPSKLLPFNEGYREIIGCAYLYPLDVSTGYINLLNSQKDDTIVEYFPVNNVYRSQTSYHFAVMLAFSLNFEKTQTFIKEHENVVKIDLEVSRGFDTYNINDFYENKLSGESLGDKVIIVSIDQKENDFLIPLANNTKMTSSEIFANIACQIIGE